ncbi:hypothetical protein IQ265_14195 [Nodosilinea sp. LEGE 06152]|uniref:hypothetical protein n=1 Tax=Nodosilinea sp. LEGE 06152 TaxID=2777966 RepID=UPI0018818E4F|nr:hypothetical protein [Nodosilinea sp. LEGE 06152]MBE9157968.1 hypothetical protein [Nodosilinea sp. LEGE 06152]
MQERPLTPGTLDLLRGVESALLTLGISSFLYRLCCTFNSANPLLSLVYGTV